MSKIRRAKYIDQFELWLAHAETSVQQGHDDAARVWLSKIAGVSTDPTRSQKTRISNLRALLALRGGL